MLSLPTLNTQPIRKQVKDDGAILEVQEVFHTIQGEGPFAGTPAVFVRLANCNLQCPLCDTDYTSNQEQLCPTTIVSLVYEGFMQMSPKWTKERGGLVVLTGGEPFRQTLGPLVGMLRYHKFEVQIETNGTLFDESLNGADGRHLLSEITIVCSPKTGTIDAALHPYISAYKYVVEDGHIDWMDGLPTSVLGNGVQPARPHAGFTGRVYVQPCDSKDPKVNEANTQAALKSCRMFGYTLCLQMHKILGLP